MPRPCSPLDGPVPLAVRAPQGFPAPLPQRDIPAVVLDLAVLFQGAPGGDPAEVVASYFRPTSPGETEVSALPFRTSAKPPPLQDSLWRQWGHLALYARDGGQVAHVGLWRLQQQLHGDGEAPLQLEDVELLGLLPSSRARRQVALEMLRVELPGPTLHDLSLVIRDIAMDEWARLHLWQPHPGVHRDNGVRHNPPVRMTNGEEWPDSPQQHLRPHHRSVLPVSTPVPLLFPHFRKTRQPPSRSLPLCSHPLPLPTVRQEHVVQLLLDVVRGPDLEAPLGDDGAPPRWRAGRRPEWAELRQAPLWQQRRWWWLRSLLSRPLLPEEVAGIREDLRDLRQQTGLRSPWSSSEED